VNGGSGEPAGPFANYQYEIYLRGMAGEQPGHPVSWADLERAAERKLDPGPAGYLFGGARTRCAPTWRPFAAGGSCRAC
jgi:hypothetical protein